jgi:hypothetical protein
MERTQIADLKYPFFTTIKPLSLRSENRENSAKDCIVRIGFNLNASRSDSVAPVGVERIQDQTRWTKALGEAVTFVYGDCTGRDSPKQM